jgi:hypothetical protein
MRIVDSAYIQQIARRTLKPRWVFHIIDQDGNRHVLPGRAVLDRQRSGAVDGGTWSLSLTVLFAMLPAGIRPRQYHRLEVSRIIAGVVYPYFVGIIDKDGIDRQLEAGSVIERITLEAFGMLQKAKGFRVDSLRIDPVTQDGIIKLRGLGKWKEWTPGVPIAATDEEQIPFGGATTGDVLVFTDSTYSSFYNEGVDYSVDRTKTPIVITWITTPADTRVIWYDALERFVIPFLGSGGGFITLPIGRDYDDLFHTWVLDFEAGTPNRIQLADRTGYGLDYYVAEDDYISVVTSDGVRHQVERSGVADVNGWQDIVGALPTGIAKGDPVWLPTTEAIAAWDDDRIYQFWTGLGGSDGTEWNRTLLKAYPSLGIAVPTPRVWSFSDEVYIDSFLGGVGYIREDVDANRIEEVIKSILTTETGLFDPSEVITEPTGVYVKNRTWSGYDLSDVLAEGKDQAMSPNTFIHDTPEGKISIKPYRQKVSADWTLAGVQSVEEVDDPEPVTAVTVIAEAERPVNLAGEWLYLIDDADNPHYITDTNRDAGRSATPHAWADAFTVIFKIPDPVPSTIHPLIDSIKITGNGLVMAFFTPSMDIQEGPWYVLPGCNMTPIESGTMEITADQIARVVTSSAGYLVIGITDVTDGIYEPGTLLTRASCSEIEILTKKSGYWRAALTDDTDLAPANNGPDEFGSIWRQPDPAKRESYRYAPTAYLKRVQPLYPSKAREKVLPMTAISQQDTRDYSERHQDEYLRAGKTYRVVAPFDDRAELGDTVCVPMMDGTKRNLLLWGMSDGGGPGDVTCTYDFIDYGR